MSYLTDRASGVRTTDRGRTPLVWLLLAVLVVMVWSAAGSASMGLPTGDLPAERWGYVLGRAIGGALFTATVVWIVLCLAVLRRTGGSAGLAFAVLLIAGVVSGGAGSVLGVGHKYFDAKTQIEATTEASRQSFDAAVQAFDAEQEAIGLHTALAPAGLKSDPNLTEAKAKIAKVRDLTERRRLGFYTLSDQARARLAALKIDPYARREVLAAFDRERVSMAKLNESGAALDQAVVAELDAYADFLIRRKGQWRVSGDMIEFYTERDLATFRMHQQTLQRLQIDGEAHDRERKAAERAMRPAPKDG